jgi:iron complex transport system substrate-binding protein
VTEIIYELGQQDLLVARDQSSTYPAAATDLTNIGYERALAPEGVLSVSPDMIIATEGAGPVSTIEVLKEAGVAYVEIPVDYSAEGILKKIRRTGSALDQTEAAEALAARVSADLEAAKASAAAAAGADPKRVLFILSTQGGRIMAGGAGTGAEGIITMSGAINAAQGFEGYKPMSAEAIATARPDVILMMDNGGHSASDADLFAMPALKLTPAARSRSVLRMNGQILLGFGPRTAEGIRMLSQALYGGAGG